MGKKTKISLSIMGILIPAIVAIIIYNWSKQDNCHKEIPQYVYELKQSLDQLSRSQYIAISLDEYVIKMKSDYDRMELIFQKISKQMEAYCNYHDIERVRQELKRNDEIVKKIIGREYYNRDVLKQNKDEFLGYDFSFSCCGVKK